MSDLLINLLASVIAGAAVWVAQRFVRYRRLARQRAFFGLTEGGACQLAVARHFSSPSAVSVHRRDVAALVELAALARECGARADLPSDAALAQEFGRATEFCVGGPAVNPRMATHLRTILPGVTMDPWLVVGGEPQPGKPGTVEYVVLARAFGPDGGRPVFLLAGQTALSNLAAARHLARRHGQLGDRFGADRPFALLLRVTESATYGIDYVEEVSDVTGVAFASPAEAE